MGCKVCFVVIGLILWAALNVDIAVSAGNDTTINVTSENVTMDPQVNVTSENVTMDPQVNVTSEVMTMAPQVNGSTIATNNQTEKSNAGNGALQWHPSRRDMFLHILLFSAIFSILFTTI